MSSNYNLCIDCGHRCKKTRIRCFKCKNIFDKRAIPCKICGNKSSEEFCSSDCKNTSDRLRDTNSIEEECLMFEGNVTSICDHDDTVYVSILNCTIQMDSECFREWLLDMYNLVYYLTNNEPEL